MTELLNQLTDALAEEVAAKVGPKLVGYVDDLRVVTNRNQLLTVSEVAKYLRVSKRTVHHLVKIGALQRAPGIGQIRIKQSVVDAYGEPKKQK